MPERVESIYISAFNHIKDTYSTHTPVFTDGSKENNKAAIGVIFHLKYILRNFHMVHLFNLLRKKLYNIVLE